MFDPNFILRDIFFLGISYIRSNLYTNCSTFFKAFSAAKLFYLTFKSRPTCSSAAFLPFSKSPTIDQPQVSTKASISAKQSLNFRIIIDSSSYRSIGLRSNKIYDLFVAESSYKYQSRNVSTRFRYFRYHMHCFDRR